MKHKCKHEWVEISHGEEVVEETKYGTKMQGFHQERCMRCGEVRKRFWYYGYEGHRTPTFSHWNPKET